IIVNCYYFVRYDYISVSTLCPTLFPYTTLFRSYTHVKIYQFSSVYWVKNRLKGENKKMSNFSVTHLQNHLHLAFYYLLLFAFRQSLIFSQFEYNLVCPNGKKFDKYIVLDLTLYIFLILYFHKLFCHLYIIPYKRLIFFQKVIYKTYQQLFHLPDNHYLLHCILQFLRLLFCYLLLCLFEHQLVLSSYFSLIFAKVQAIYHVLYKL